MRYLRMLLFILLGLMLSTCGPKQMTVLPSGIKIVKQTTEYTIGQRTSGDYIVFAGTVYAAMDAIRKELKKECGASNGLCSINQSGVIVLVEPLQED